jgi:hypothetical protein
MGASFYGLRAEILGYHFSIPLGSEVLSNSEQSPMTIFPPVADLRRTPSAQIDLSYDRGEADF